MPEWLTRLGTSAARSSKAGLMCVVALVGLRAARSGLAGAAAWPVLG